MFSLTHLFFKFLNKFKPERDANKFAKQIIIVMDIIVMIIIIGIVKNAENEVVEQINDVFLDIIKMFILSVILSASINGKLFKKEKAYESEGNFIGVKLLLYLVPLMLAIIPIFANVNEYPKIALILYYIIFVMLTNVILNIVEGVFLEEMHKDDNDSKEDNDNRESQSIIRERHSIGQKIRKSERNK